MRHIFGGPVSSPLTSNDASQPEAHVRCLDAQLWKLIPGPRIPMKNPQMKSVDGRLSARPIAEPAMNPFIFLAHIDFSCLGTDNE